MASGTTTFSAVLQAYSEEGGSHLNSLLSNDVSVFVTNYYNHITEYFVYVFYHLDWLIRFSIVVFVTVSLYMLLLIPVFFLLGPLLRKVSNWHS